jgi:hypothetical protein
MRGAIAVILFALCAAPAYAQAQSERAYAATARLMVEVLAPSSYGDWAYSWGAVSSRISRHMHWHLPDPDPRDRGGDAEIRRNGWIDEQGRNVGVTAIGDEARVLKLHFRIDDTRSEHALLDALRASGDVQVEQAPEPFARYTLTPRDRDAASLERVLSCTSPRSAAAQRCWLDYTLTLPRRPAQN